MSNILKKTALLFVITSMILASPTPRVQAHGNGATPPDSFIIRGGPPPLPETGSFINYEIPHVHPLDINSAATRLAACNTPDGTIEIYSVNGTNGNLTHIDAIRVGYAPVSARFRTDTELWVVNHISDSISIIDITSVPGKLIDTIQTYDGYDGSLAGDEPADVVFVTGDIALVSGSRSDTIQRYTASTGAYIGEFTLDGEDPRMLAVNAAGTNVYAAIFESGNSSTAVRSGGVSSGAGPYTGENPPRDTSTGQDGWDVDGSLVLRIDLTNPPPPVSLIVKKDFGDGDKWKDDNGTDWTTWVSGASAGTSGRFNGWDLLDNDVAMLTSGDSFVSATYITRQMNHVMAIAINPENGDIWAVGTDATNEIRFEPNITGTFTRVMLSINNSTGTNRELVDLNEEHLDAAQSGGGTAYEDSTITTENREKSIGDPRGIAFNTTTDVAYITGMGSNNVVGVNSGGATRGAAIRGERFAIGHNVPVGQGPTGIVHNTPKSRLYVLNKFSASITVINTATPGSESTVQTLSFFDPTPDFINLGRVHQYDTHENSGLGQIACASCHIDSRMGRLAWDLGNPAGGSPQGVEKFVNTADILSGIANVHNFLGTLGETNQNGNPFHTMKGPMTTQTLQDIIRHEPLHWRGDRDSIEEFSGAFAGLQGGPVLNAFKMQEYEDFLSTIHFPPNPFRPLDNSLPGGPQFIGGGTNPTLPLPGHFSPGTKSFSALGTSLPNGNAWAGFEKYMDQNLDGPGVFDCVECHSLPMGSGSITTGGGTPIPFGPDGQSHLGMVSNDGTGEPRVKVPQMRNQMDKEGLFLNEAGVSRAGFGVLHDGTVSGLARFLAASVFTTATDADLANIVAFSLCINGGQFPELLALDDITGNIIANGSPDGGPQQTAHAAVGQQVMITSSTPPMADQDLIDLFVILADVESIGLIATGLESSVPRSWYHVSGIGAGALFQPDDGGATETLTTVQGNASVSDPLTFMAVPTVSDIRMGADRDEDTVHNGIENDFNSDNGNPEDQKWVDGLFGGSPDGSPTNPFTTVAAGIAAVSPSPGKSSAVHIQTGTYNEPITITKRTHLVAVGGTVVIGAP